MEKRKRVFAEARALYLKSARPMGKWMWNNHVQWVADRANKLAEKYGASADKVYCAALLHDLADSHYERGHKDFKSWSESKGKEILQGARFNEKDVTEIIEIIIRPHSCHQSDELPSTLEGKVLSTADAMFHLQTAFFPMLCYMHRPETVMTYESWQDWFGEKVEREFNIKIFFEDERSEVAEDYKSLSRVFNNRSLNSELGYTKSSAVQK